MRGNSNYQNPIPSGHGARARRIRSDLEFRGVAPEFSLLVARRLGAISPDLTGREYDAVLDGVAAAYRVHAEARDLPVEHSIGVNEIQRLAEGFASELARLQSMSRVDRASIGRAGRDLVTTRFSLEHMNEGYEAIYRELCSVAPKAGGMKA